MENKKNTLTIVLIIVIAILCVVIGWLLGSKLANDGDDVIDTQTTEENNNQESNNNQEEVKEIAIQEAFNNFVTGKNLKTSSDVYDWNALHSKNCTDAVSASGEGYSLELYVFEDEESAKKEYNTQNNYQLESNNVKQVIGSENTNDYNYYEATLVPNLEMSPAATGDENIYLYQLRVDNFYVILYETSTNSDKTNMINIANELKVALGVK